MVKENIEDFFRAWGEIEYRVYNEISLQLELGCFLRKKLPKGYQIWFEKPIQKAFDERVLNRNNIRYVKKEIDLLITDEDKKVIACIELKYSTNGQYPQQMTKFCQDIRFLEQLYATRVKECLFVCLVDDDLFYNGNRGLKADGIYRLFRTDGRNEPAILDPNIAQTIPSIQGLDLEHAHRLAWKRIPGFDKYRYLLVD